MPSDVVSGKGIKTIGAMSQLSLSDAEYAGKRKKSRREVFLEEMEQVVPWKALLKNTSSPPESGRSKECLIAQQEESYKHLNWSTLQNVHNPHEHWLGGVNADGPNSRNAIQ